MVFDAQADHKRWLTLRLWLWLALGVTLAVAVFNDDRSDLRHWQRHAPKELQAQGGAPSGVRELLPDGKHPERCVSCHLGIDAPINGLAAPYQRHSWPLTHHTPKRIGCVVCHGGEGRALTAAAAHARAGTSERSARLTLPYLEASCAQCHLPGAVPQTEHLVRGAYLFLELGCGLCHSLAAGGRGGWDDGPDLRTTRQASVEALTQSILDPTTDFPDSTMPSYRTTFADKPEALADLNTYVLSLALSGGAPRDQVAPRINPTLSCNTCHATTMAMGNFHHDCVYLHDRRNELRCSGCHADGAPQGRGLCPILVAHASACLACHTPKGP